jgi:hypothetical protein
MRFLVDENVRREVRVYLEEAGHEVFSCPAGASDPTLAQYARERHCIIITHDVHFANVIEYPPEDYNGIIRLRFHPPYAADMISALGKLFHKISPAEIVGILIILEKEGYRIR